MHNAVALACVLLAIVCGSVRAEPALTAEAALVAARRDYRERVVALIHPDHRRLVDFVFERAISIQVGLVQTPDTPWPLRPFAGFTRPEVKADDTLFFPIFGRAEAVQAVKPPVWVLTLSTISSVYDFYLDGTNGTILYIRGVLEG